MQDPQKSNLLYIGVFVLTIFTVTAVVFVTFLQPNKDNTSLIASILGFVVPIIGLLLAGQNKQQNDRLDRAAVERHETSANVKELKETVDGKMDKIVELTAVTARAEGVKETTDANQRLAADIANVAAHEEGRLQGVAEERGREMLPPIVTTADGTSPGVAGEPVEVIVRQKGS